MLACPGADPGQCDRWRWGAGREPGNRTGQRADYLGMDCALAREAVSAMLDGEDPKADSGELDGHLAACAECRPWRDAAHEVTRRVRLGAAQPVPRRTREVVAAMRARHRWWRVRPVLLCRLGLVAVAVGQLAVTVPCLLFGYDSSAPVHVAHELGSFDAALAAGFLVVAWRPGRALGVRALVGAAAVLLVLTAVIDLVRGRTSVLDEAPHLLAVAGWLMICGLAASTPPTVTEPRSHLPGAIRSRLRVPAWGGAGSASRPDPPAAPDSPAASSWLMADRDLVTVRARPGRGAIAAGCGCVTGQCGCPGCAAPRRVSGG
jgi:predicted anti-sigma-YlaC factor YlaD